MGTIHCGAKWKLKKCLQAFMVLFCHNILRLFVVFILFPRIIATLIFLQHYQAMAVGSTAEVSQTFLHNYILQRMGNSFPLLTPLDRVRGKLHVARMELKWIC